MFAVFQIFVCSETSVFIFIDLGCLLRVARHQAPAPACCGGARREALRNTGALTSRAPTHPIGQEKPTRPRRWILTQEPDQQHPTSSTQQAAPNRQCPTSSAQQAVPDERHSTGTTRSRARCEARDEQGPIGAAGCRGPAGHSQWAGRRTLIAMVWGPIGSGHATRRWAADGRRLPRHRPMNVAGQP